jgi:hypothetical protein
LRTPKKNLKKNQKLKTPALHAECREKMRPMLVHAREAAASWLKVASGMEIKKFIVSVAASDESPKDEKEEAVILSCGALVERVAQQSQRSDAKLEQLQEVTKSAMQALVRAQVCLSPVKFFVKGMLCIVESEGRENV